MSDYIAFQRSQSKRDLKILALATYAMLRDVRSVRYMKTCFQLANMECAGTKRLAAPIPGGRGAQEFGYHGETDRPFDIRVTNTTASTDVLRETNRRHSGRVEQIKRERWAMQSVNP